VGRVFTLYGKARTTALPTTGIATFANDSYPGSGEVLVSKGKGEQQTFTRTIQGESWFEFTTAGDGTPGNSLVVSPDLPRSYQTKPLVIARAEIPQQYENSPIVFDFELSGALAHAERASQHYVSTDLHFQYNSYPQIPLANLDLQEKAVVTVTAPDGSTSEVMYFVHGGQLAYTDGTLSNVARVGGTGSLFAMNPSELRSLGSELIYLSKDFGSDTNRLNLLSAPNDTAISLVESSPGNQIVTFVVQNNLIVARTEAGNLIRIDLSDLSVVQVPGSYLSISEMTIVGSTLYFANSSMFLQSLDLTSTANTTPTILQSGSFQSLTASTLGGGTLFFRSGPNLWRSSGTVTSTILLKDVAGPAQSLIDINGSLFFTVNSELWTSNGTNSGTVQVALDSDGQPLLQATSLTSVNGRLFFSGSRTNNRFDVYVADANGGVVTIQQVAALGIDVSLGANSEATNFTGVGPLVYFSTRESATTYLYKMDGTASGTTVVRPLSGPVSHFTNLNGQLGFLLGDAVTEFYLSDGITTKASREAAFRIGLQKGKAPGFISEEDVTRPKYPESTISLDGYANSNQLFAGNGLTELHSGLMDALERGFLRVAMNLTPETHWLFPVANVIVSVNIFGYNDENRLVLNPVTEGVLVDLFEASGRLIKRDASAIDMRSIEAGRYLLRAHTVGSSVQTATFTFVAPIEGETHEIYLVNDRDKVVGGDGNDSLIGNSDVDRLIGGQGTDIFRSDKIESRDQQNNEIRLASEATDSLSTAPKCTDHCS
jgi:hypothetical protein